MMGTILQKRSIIYQSHREHGQIKETETEVMPHNSDTEQIHAGLLELLTEFDRLCRKNGIRYSLHGGTLLGCIREGGFIPWDDDVDISMTREEYNKLEKIITGQKDLELDTDINRFPQLWLETADHQSVWLDIFIWDGISEKKPVQRLKIVLLCFFLGFMKTKETMRLSSESKAYTGAIHFAIRLAYLAGRLFPYSIKKKMASRTEQSLQGSGKYIHRSNDLYRGMKLVLPSYVMSRYEDKAFEGQQVMVSSYYHEILVSSYGEDYMTPVKAPGGEFAVHALARKLHQQNKKMNNT